MGSCRGREKPSGMKDKWLQQGYTDFAKEGPQKGSISRIGQEIGASRSSFYHHFAEIDLFVDELLARHWAVCQEFNQTGKVSCKSLNPNLDDLLAAYPLALQFSRQVPPPAHSTIQLRLCKDL